MALLEQERACFDANKAEWLVLYKNQYVLIKGSELAGVFGGAETPMVLD